MGEASARKESEETAAPKNKVNQGKHFEKGGSGKTAKKVLPKKGGEPTSAGSQGKVEDWDLKQGGVGSGYAQKNSECSRAPPTRR